MSEVWATEILDVDAAELVDAARSGDETIQSIVEFNRSQFNTLYVSDQTRALYESEAAMESHFERIHNYVNIDFTEIQMFTTDLFSMADHVRYKTTALDLLTMVRLYTADQSGLFFGVNPGDDVEPLVKRLEAVVSEA